MAAEVKTIRRIKMKVNVEQTKRLLALIMAVVMMLSLLPMSVFAEGSAAPEEVAVSLQMDNSSSEKPYFENLQFMTSAVSDWNASTTFSPTTLTYQLTIKTYRTSQLVLNSNTKYDKGQYNALAEYIDVNGDRQEINVNSEDLTYFKNIPFDSSTLTITISEKDNSANNTVYTFNVTRPRDITTTIKATTGVVVVPNGRSLLATIYKDKAEGTMFRVDDNGTVTATTGIATNHYKYQAYVVDSLDAFALTLAGTTNYTHLRYSVDERNWADVTSGQNTTLLSFGAADSITVTVQVISDRHYTDNIEAGKTGFETVGTDGQTYTIKVGCVDIATSDARLSSASTESGDWYPEFDPGMLTYNIIVPNGIDSDTLSYTIPDGAKAYVGTILQEPQNGVYTLALSTSAKTLTIKNSEETISNVYSFTLHARSRYAVPDAVVDYLCMNSQYTNGVSYGLQPELTLKQALKSLGNFGGYITYYYEDAIMDNHNNPYGVDFYIYGNAFKGAGATASYGASGEPGQVWVSNDNIIWYALAGSEHYEESTIKDYEITYSKTALGKTAWSDNMGNSNDGTSQSGTWPLLNNYYLNDLVKNDSFTLSGILLKCQDGTVTGSGRTDSYAGCSDFGYVDAVGNSEVGSNANPYTGSKITSGFDLAWAVDGNGNPVSLPDGVHYVKVATASNIWAGSFGEKSTEVTAMMLATAVSDEVGITDAPLGVTISDASSNTVVNFTAGKTVYNVNVDNMKYVSIAVNGAQVDDNIYINNQRIPNDGSAGGFTVTKDSSQQVRVIVQNGEKEPVIYMLSLSGMASTKSDLIENIFVNVGGNVKAAIKNSNIAYSLDVGYKISSISIAPITAKGVSCTVNEETLADSYSLQDGINTFTIDAYDGNTRQTVTLTVTKATKPVSTGTITVYLTVLGDSNHGGSVTHTYKNNRSELEEWIARTGYTVDSSATAWDVIKTALEANRMSYVNAKGNYIVSVNGLAEFDNGKNSGWMYLINGKYSDYGVGEQVVKNGDKIILYYTDDYTKETGSEKWDKSNTVGAEKEVPLFIIAAMQGDEMPFIDVTVNNWFYDAVKYSFTNKFMNGTSADKFSPNNPMTRAMLVTVLYRYEGQPDITSETLFTDVAAGTWYTKAVIWANENKIVEGYGNGIFGTSDDITREQMATVLMRYAKWKGLDVSTTTELVVYTDATQISGWAIDAVKWANAEGLIKGRTNTEIAPKDTATRAEVVTLLMRFIDKT